MRIVCISDTHTMLDKIKRMPKGDVLTVAKIAGIQFAARRDASRHRATR